MPELAEVEYYRKQWNVGLRQRIKAVELHAAKRIFRKVDTALLRRTLCGAALRDSKTHGKQMLFRFSKDAWLGIHLGMTGKLRTETLPFAPGAHDHLVLFLKSQALVFSDPRLFGRVLFHVGKNEPPWWIDLPAEILSPSFTMQHFAALLRRHGGAPIKAVLLMQHAFPGIGNWMADEILWQSRVHPRTRAGKTEPAKVQRLRKKMRSISSFALKTIAKDFSDPPASWLFEHRWKKKGKCPRCAGTLERATIGGRTTCWCPKCQPSA